MICHQCGHDNRETARFCEDCGAGLLSAHPSSVPPSEPRITVFTPEPERKVVTALFSDLTGYTALTEKLDPSR
jgi:class 3 adenylate cyclase